MKHLKCAFLCICCSVFSLGEAQVNHLKTFFFAMGGNTPLPYTYFDSVSITNKVNDTLWFETIAYPDPKLNVRYRQEGTKIYLEEDKEILLYDYSLQLGDTFFFEAYGDSDTLLVDSVYDHAFAYGTHKAWRLRSAHFDYKDGITWVQHLGSMEFGFDYSRYMWLHSANSPVARCIHDTLIYWDSTTIGWFHSYDSINATCDFRLLKDQTTSVDENLLAGNIKMYPVPAGDRLYIELGNYFTGTVEVMNIYGQVVLSRKFESLGQLQLDLPPGNREMLLVKMSGEDFLVTRKIIRL